MALNHSSEVEAAFEKYNGLYTLDSLDLINY